MALRRQTEPARGGEIERRRVARQFADDKRQIATAYPFFQREQRIGRFVGGDMDQPVAQPFGQARTIGPLQYMVREAYDAAICSLRA